MALLKIDITRYLELVQQEKELKNRGKRFFQENREAALELARYRIIVRSEVEFRHKVEYLELIQNFVDEKIDGYDMGFESSSSFYWLFYWMWRRDRDQLDVLEQDFLQKSEPILETDSRANSFSDLIYFIFAAGEAATGIDPESGFADLIEIDERNYREEVRRYFLEMQELLKED